MIGPADIAKLASDRAFSNRLVTNVYRGIIAEAVVAAALGPDWRWCSEDYYQFDFLHVSGARLEVKQSAACQSWPTKAASTARWDIAARKSLWDGKRYVPHDGRNADIYVLCWHPIPDRDVADHRDPEQWEFFVISAAALGPAKTIGMTGAQRHAVAVQFTHLADSVLRSVAELALASGRAENRVTPPALPS
jgi:hypothetical protein